MCNHSIVLPFIDALSCIVALFFSDSFLGRKITQAMDPQQGTIAMYTPRFMMPLLKARP